MFYYEGQPANSHKNTLHCHADNLRFDNYPPSGGPQLEPTPGLGAPPPATDWRHVAWVRDVGELRYYINGVLTGTEEFEAYAVDPEEFGKMKGSAGGGQAYDSDDEDGRGGAQRVQCAQQ